MAKRKRNETSEPAPSEVPKSNKKAKPALSITIQIVAGSYDRVLHGITATVSSTEAQFADTFLFNAHGSAIRCLAISPPSAPVPNQAQKILLASGSTDERINLYHLSAHAPSKITVPIIPSLTSKAVVENPQNKELGSLLHHSSAITSLYFPNRSKLLSSAEDRQIAVTRTRDWSLLSSIKSPAPKEVGRPSGDTAPSGGAPSGINGFAVHPSMKLMISVGKGEKCMRLWNLVTGKKAGVLNFDREQLSQVGEGRHNTGEGRKVAWGATDAGDEFCVGFERGVLVYGMDSKPKCKVVPEPRTKIHHLRYVQVGEGEDVQLMVVSTEDGRILFFSTKSTDLIQPNTDKKGQLPSAKLVAQLGGKEVGLLGRVKDFTILPLEDAGPKQFIIVAAGSDGSVRLWRVTPSKDLIASKDKVKQIEELLGTYETGNRITCMVSFVMLPSIDEDEAGNSNDLDDDDVEDEEESSSSDSE